MSGTQPSDHTPVDGELPAGWELCSIGALPSDGEFFDGDWVESKDQDPTGDVRLTQLADVGEGTFRDRSDRWLRPDQAEQLQVNYLQEGDLLIARMPDPLGRCCLLPRLEYPAVTVVDVAVLRIRNPKINNPFIMWILNSPSLRQLIVELASGTTRQRISRKNLGTIELPIPPLAEQERIVEILEEQLSRLDAALESVRIVRKKAAQFRRSLLHSAVVGTLTGDSADGTDLPEAWKPLTLGDLSKLIRNGIFVSRPAASPPGLPIFRISAVRQMHLDAEDVRYVDPEPPRAEEFRLTPGDLLFTRYSGSRDFVGACAVVPAECEGVMHPDKLIRVIVDDTQVTPAFAAVAASSPLGREWLESVMRTTAGQTGIAGRDLRRFPILTPPVAKQKEILEILEEQLSRLDAALAVADSVEKRSAALRRSLLHAAFTGRLTEQWREQTNV